tara:strand:- start:12266 stop:13060 length:795 start_codon:yes stop_codon:yes gene_type:complete
MIYKARLELSFKDLDQLAKKLEFCRENDILKINVPCKGNIKKDLLIDAVEFIGTYYQQFDVVYHYSFYHQFYKNKSYSYDKFIKFLEIIRSYKNKEILLISGSQKRNNFEVLDILEYLKLDLRNKVKIGVAYNPYFEEIRELNIERERLFNKLNSGLINSIWLQFGSGFHNLIKEINFIREIKKSKVDIYGSIFIPSKQNLARFKFRPWRGVFLSKEYLDSLETSKIITKNILEIYIDNKVIPLIESECSTEKQLTEVRNFIDL